MQFTIELESEPADFFTYLLNRTNESWPNALLIDLAESGRQYCRTNGGVNSCGASCMLFKDRDAKLTRDLFGHETPYLKIDVSEDSVSIEGTEAAEDICQSLARLPIWAHRVRLPEA